MVDNVKETYALTYSTLSHEMFRKGQIKEGV